MTWWVTRRHSRKPVWTSGKKSSSSVGGDINLANPFDPFYLLTPLSSFFSLSLPRHHVFLPQWKMMRPRRGMHATQRKSSVAPSGDRLLRSRVCVTRHKAGRSALDGEYSAKCPAFSDPSLRFVFWAFCLHLFFSLRADFRTLNHMYV